ncbi:hypothetical protein PLESTB_000624300 [Pleodorina starrii]|uniref:Uncharacterized protein n=1 Tax=Pleodorina starrii TaxID=330485 RepID=A0A9W6F153_9CHLO|nr:hypothetical protein PLESTB_000624300 [Pleodorina starrii]
MQHNAEDGQSIAARLRLLGPPTPQVDESKIALAVALAEDLFAAATSSPPRADDPPLPVLAHYCRNVTEWAASCILKTKPPPPLALETSQPGACAAAAATTTAGPGVKDGRSRSGGGPTTAKRGAQSAMPQDGAAQDPRAAYLTRALRLWRLLQLMLEAGDPRVNAGVGSTARRTAAALALAGAAAGSVPASILNSAAACLRVALAQPWATATAAGATDGDVDADADGEPQLPLAAQLCRAVRCCLNVLLPTSGGGGAATGGGGMRPSLEQCLALLTTLLDARPPSRRGTAHQSADATSGDGTGAHCENAAATGEWARLCAAVVHVTHGSVQGHPAPKKVWKAFVPELVMPLLAVSQTGEALGATLQLVLGVQVGGAAAAATGASPASVLELGRAAQQLLTAVLFHEAHVGALAELFAALLPGGGGGEPQGETATAATAADAGADAAASADAVMAAADEGGTGGSSGKGDGGGGGGASGPEQLLLPGFWELVGRSYHGQLLQVLATAAAGDTGSSERSRRGGGGGGGGGAFGSSGTAAGGTADTILQGMPWLLRTYCRAVARLRRNLASDAAAAGVGGGAAGKGKRLPAADGAAGGGERDEDGMTAGAASQKALAAAEFNCMAVLSYILLQPPQPQAGGADAAAGRPAKKRKLAAAAAAADTAAPAPAAPSYNGSGGPWRRLALAALLAAGRAIGAYQPTRDLTGAHCAVLAVIADRLLSAVVPEAMAAATTAVAAAAPSDAKSDAKDAKAQRKAAAGRAAATPTTGGGACASGGVAGDAAGVEPYGSLRSLSTSLALCAVLDLDHRVLTPHLERVWSLLWSTAAGDCSPPTTTTTTVTGSAAVTSRPVGAAAAAAAAATAAAVLQRTLRAFSELRQLQALLESLGAAMRAVYSGGGSGAEGLPVVTAEVAAQGGGCGGGDGGVVAALLVRPEVTAALRQAIGSAPSGQLPALVGWVATDFQAWCEVAPSATHGSVSASADLFLAAGALYDTLLAALRLDLATAMPVAKASVRLLEALAAPLLSSVRQYCKARSAATAAAAEADGDAEAAAELRLRMARLAMLLRVYGSAVHTNAVCAGLHPEIPPLPDQDIAPRRREDLQQSQQPQAAPHAEPRSQGGYFAPLLHHAATAAAQAADGGDAAIADELKRLRKALKRAGSDQYRSGPLPALAQIVLLPGVSSPPPPPLSPSLAPVGAGTAAGMLPSALSPSAASWAEVELSRAVHRCLGQRLQTLHERLLRRRHDCPLYGRAPSLGGAGNGAGNGKPASATAAAGTEVAVAPTAEAGAEEKADTQAETEEAEARLLANLLLAPFSPKAAAAAGTGDGSHPQVLHSGSAGGSGVGSAAVAAATTATASYTAAAWGDVLALMGSIGPWAERAALAEVLQLALAAACRGPPSVVGGGGGAAAATNANANAAGDFAAQLRPLHTGSAASLRLLEFQGLPGVRQTLPCAWMAAVADALAGVAAETRRLLSSAPAAAAAASKGPAVEHDGPGMRPSKKARKAVLQQPSEPAGEGGVAAASAAAVATGESLRLEALLAAAKPKEMTGDGEDGEGGGGSGKSFAKVLKRVMAQQAEALGSVGTSWMVGVDENAVPSVDAPAEAAGGGNGVAAAAAALRSLLALLYDRLYLELTPHKARQALVRQVAATTAAAVDLLLLLRHQAAAAMQAAAAARTPKHVEKKTDKREQQQQQQQHQSIRRELLGIIVACLRAWRRLSAAYGSGDCGGGEFASFDVSSGGGGGAAEDGAGDDDGNDGADLRVTWLVRVCELLVMEAAALDGGGGAGRPLSFEVTHHSGHLLSTLLSAREGAVARELEVGSVDEGGKAIVRPRLNLATRLLSQAECASAPATRALLCRLGLAAVQAAAAAAAPGAAASDAVGRKAGVRGGSSGQGSVAGAHKALHRLSALLERLLSSSHHIGSSADEAAAAAAAAAAPAEGASRTSAVHVLRAALCLVGCHGHVMQLSLPCTASATAGGDGGGDGGGGGAKTSRKEAATAAAADAAAAATAAVRLSQNGDGGGGGSDLGLLLRASRWVAAERRLYDMLAPRGGGGDAAAAAAVAAEPLEHCVTLMYGIGSWLPALGHGGGRVRDGGDGQGGGEQVEGGGVEASGGIGSASDEALTLLVAVQQSLLLACTASPERFCYSRTSNMWGVLLADLDPAGAAYLSRKHLLDCFRSTLLHSNRGQLAALLRGLTSRLRQEGLTEPGQPPAQLLPPLQCLLTSLECLAGPRVSKLLLANGPAVTAALTELLSAAAARASVAASGGTGSDEAACFFGGAANRAATETVLCCALRCLQSVAGREVTFRLAAPAVTGVLSAVMSLAACPLLWPQPLLPNTTAAACGGGGGGGSGQDLYFLHAGCCGLVAAVVRHHEPVVRHCAALVVGACRELLLRLVAWASELRTAQRQLQLRAATAPAPPAAVAVASDGLERCAAALARVYEAVSEHPKTLGKYATHILADYIVHAATPLPSLALLMHAKDGGNDPWVMSDVATTDAVPDAAALESGAFGAGVGSSAGVGATLLPQRAHEALRQGAFSLMGCMGPPQLQHLHMAMGTAAGADAGAGPAAAVGGGARRAALAQLRKEYDSSYKYTGKV